jgi:hypothetical protein
VVPNFYLTDIRQLAKLLVECKQEIPECLESFKPELPPDAPLFEEDDDDEDDEAPPTASVPPVSQGAAWDAGDNSVVFQGDALRNIPLQFS